MKLSVFTTFFKAETRGDNLLDALYCYRDLADEVIGVDGYSDLADGVVTKTIGKNPQMVHLSYEWPQEFSWEFIGQQFQRGYELATGDWVIHADLDFIFHEKDFEKIRKACEDNPTAPALNFYKWQFTLPDRYNLKSRLVLAVNKKQYGDRIRFDSGGDLCQPSLDGKYINPEDVPESKIEFYNYEKLLKTESQIKDDVERMARAWTSHFKDQHLGTDETAYTDWLAMSKGRFSKPQRLIPLSDHPKYVQETIRNLQPDNWGHSGFGNLCVNYYAKPAETQT